MSNCEIFDILLCERITALKLLMDRINTHIKQEYTIPTPQELEEHA